MRQGTGYAYDGDEDCISYKCEGCGQRVRITPAQVQHSRGTYMACSRVCVLKARDLRTRQWRLEMGVPGSSEGAVPTRAPGSEEGATQER